MTNANQTKGETMKPTHANVHATSMCFGGFRATVMAGNKVVASRHFKCNGWGKSHSDAAWNAMKKWMAQFGVQ